MVARTAGRKGRPYRRCRATVFARDGDVCYLCGHPGATEIDHISPWALDPAGRLDPDNMAPAHGSWGKCPVCKLACNQVRGLGRPVPVASPTSRTW